MNLLTIIYSSNLENLSKFKDKATHWLPETFEQLTDIYQPPNVICTTKDTILELIKTSIQAGNINHLEVIYIDASQQAEIVTYTFNQTGDVNNFFRI